MHEMQDDARIAAHGPRYVTDDDKRRMAPARVAPAQGRNAAGAKLGAQGCPHVDAPPMGIGRQPPRRKRHDGKLHARYQPFGAGEFLGRHFLEVDGLQQFAVGIGHGGVEFDLFLLRYLAVVSIASGAACLQGLGQATAQFLAFVDVFAARRQARQQHGHHAFQKLRIAPENMERLIEERALILAIDED